MKEYYKISFTGDIMCERPLLSASRSDKKYDFDFVFHGVKDKLRESDLVVGNLETVLLGRRPDIRMTCIHLILRIVLYVQ